MKGKDVRCPHCGASALSSVAPNFELENSSNEFRTYNTYFFLECDGKPRHSFTFSADEQRAMSTKAGARSQDKLALLDTLC